MLRLMVMAVLAFTALTLGAMAAIYVVTSRDPAQVAAPGGRGPGAAETPAAAPLVVLPEAPAPAAPVPVPPAQVVVSAPPPVVPAEPEARSTQLLAFREARRGDAIDQLNAREALRRQRLGLPPPAPAPARPAPTVHGAQARFSR